MAYRHSITDGRLAGIYYNNTGGQRRRKNLSGLRFPMDAVQNVYAFYCAGDGPSLIYVDSQSPMAKGWYKKELGTDTWRWTYAGIKSYDLNNELMCDEWMKLKITLEGCGCGGLPECSGHTMSLEQLKKELEKEEREQEKLRRVMTSAAAQPQLQEQTLPPAPVRPPQDSASSDGSRRDVSPVHSTISFTSSSQQDDTGIPHEVTIDINKRSVIGQTIYGGNASTVYITPNSTTLDGFTEYIHKAYDRKGDCFTVKEFKYRGEKTNNIPKTSKVTSVSVCYWAALETRNQDTSRPLLVKITQRNPGEIQVKEIYYDNVSSKLDDNTQWRLWTEFSPKPDELRDRLTSLNCSLNYVVNIDVSRTRGNYCGHLKAHIPGRVKVENVDDHGGLGNYKAYKHELNTNSGNTFHISALKYGNGKILTGVPTPVLDVSSVTVYFCARDTRSGGIAQNPLMIYIDSAKLGKESKWFQKPDKDTDPWKSVELLPENDRAYDKIVGILDTLSSPCKLADVTIDIYQRGTSSARIFYPHSYSVSNRILVTGVGGSPPGFTEYKHTDNSASKNTFTVSGFEYNKEKVKAGLSGGTSKVTGVSVYYWSPLEDPTRKGHPDKRGRPLLVKVVTKDLGGEEKSTYYENKGDPGNLNWMNVNDDLKGANLEVKLKLLNCKLNDAVTVDLSYTASYKGNWYCCADHNSKDKKIYFREVQVSCKHKSPSISAYRHFIGVGATLAGIKYHEGDKVKNITLTGQRFPMDGVESISVFYCGEVPKLIYLEGGVSTVSNKWFKRDSSDAPWEEVRSLNIIPDKLTKTINCNKYNQVVNVLKHFVGCSNYQECNKPKENGPKPLLKAAPQPAHHTTSETSTPLTAPSVTTPEPTAEERDPEAKALAEIPIAATTSLWLTFGAPSATLTGAGGLTGLGWWAFKRSKGDPWVRQI
ncbi:hypothetical protein BEWA_029940 [Theileria equi strain WA]|uniref:Uncharacterized protein n=1 Tax=Theileria equi strain WA TaxID=1537102 RepID=L0AX24_THEEQ|nr:hypothetical protein BEWA_029940 [Theileria equi strain WA]AFZ80142.1 hypothetical protein BEWA_029940 [Theileria equi strain WA]|eukprot:XP_004829808.1 hypothetical protein BEWA_029940 [Theileria equi strain WA]